MSLISVFRHHLLLGNDFYSTFGFSPSFGEPCAREAQQAMVDAKLRLLAEHLAMIFDCQGANLKEFKEGHWPRANLEAQKEWTERFRELAGEIKKSKRAFWEAHALAAKAGFDVKSKYSDYIPKEEWSECLFGKRPELAK